MSWFSRFSGDENRRGYVETDQPGDRLALFRLVVKDHFFDLIAPNLVLLAVLAPLLFWVGTGGVYVLSALGADGTLADFLSLSLTWALGMLPCIALTGPLLAGMARVMRNLARDDSRFRKDTFFAGFREDWKGALAVSAVTGLIPLCLWASAALYGPRIAAGERWASVPLLLGAVVCLVWLMACPTLYVMLGTYRQGLREQVKNALALTLARLPLVTGVALLNGLPLLLGVAAFFIGGTVLNVAAFVLCVYYLLFGFAFQWLIQAALANKLCEETLNPKIDGAGTHIGMRGNP